MAEPMTPATLGPMACISRKLEGLAFWPSTLDTRAAIGTADTPAEPMRGLTLPPVAHHMILPPSRPPTVDRMKAHTPRPTIIKVCAVRKVEPVMVATTAVDSRMVTMFISAF